jgi:hypothetical protein
LHGLEQHADQDFRIAGRNADSSKTVNWVEIHAIRFATELLMPTDFMVEDLGGLEVMYKRAVALLAKNAVGGEAMKIRSSQLGIVGPY